MACTEFSLEGEITRPRMLEALIRRMTSLTGVTYTGVKPFDSEIVGELKTTISQIIAKKLSIKQDVIEDLKTEADGDIPQLHVLVNVWTCRRIDPWLGFPYIVFGCSFDQFFGTFPVGELKTTISQIIAKKLSIKQDVIEDLKTAEELFPVRTELEQTTILSPLRTPSTSGILLDDDSSN
jgi:hypothetical protein